MMPLVWAAAFFAAVLLDTSSKLKVMAGAAGFLSDNVVPFQRMKILGELLGSSQVDKRLTNC
jgi:hypothetical protein